MRIQLGWQVSSFFGWGVYGLNLALQWSLRDDVEAWSIYPLYTDQVIVDALELRALLPFANRSGKDSQADLHIVCLSGNVETTNKKPRIGAIFFENLLLPDAVESARSYDLIITGSKWNETVLRDAGVERVATILQGVDPARFHPAPKRELYPGKYLIFSGGKAEPRKGQDIVVKAFRAFASRHPDAMLVTAWHSPWPDLKAGMNLDLSDLSDRVIDLGAVPNALMAPIYRECDVALFPNRAEGGTNLVAMECIACGVPTILSANTGHIDLLDRGAGYPLKKQSAYANGWSESDLDEVVEALEFFKRRSWGDQPRNLLPDLTWARTASEMLSTVAPFVR